jgi:hypothetical protein
MKKTLYTNGDSFVFGMETMGPGSRDVACKDHSFAKHLSRQLNCDTYINKSYNGSGNDHIFKRTIFDLNELEKQGVKPEDTFVLIGWSSLSRIEISGESWLSKIPNWKSVLEHFKQERDPSYPVEFQDFGVVFCNPHSGITLTIGDQVIDTDNSIVPWAAKYLWDDVIQVPNQEARIIALHELLENRGYAHLFVNTCHPLFDTKNIDFSCKNYYNLDTGSFYDYGVLNYPDQMLVMNHFTEVPHIFYAEKLFEYIQQHNIS